MSLPQRVVAARKKKGLTQEELAGLATVTVRTIQRIESGETTPRPYTLEAIAAALDIPFQELHTTTGQQEFSDVSPNVNPANDTEDHVYFLQLLCLSCFSYLVVPVIHFLLPIYLLRRRKEQNQRVLVYARWVIKVQVYWVITLNLLLLLSLAYNILCSVYSNSSYTINYLVPFFIMYGVNAYIISAALVRVKTKAFSVPAFS